jgi:uncharacterized protein (DUF433 family)
MSRKVYPYFGLDRKPHAVIRYLGGRVTSDPRIRFGARCLAGTRILAKSLAYQVLAGDDARTVSLWFEVTDSQVKTSIQYMAKYGSAKEKDRLAIRLQQDGITNL